MLNLGFEKVPGLTSISLSLVLPVAVFLAEIVAFTVLRAKFKTIYEPRTFIPPLSKRAPPLPPAIYNLDPDDIRRQNGLDAYVFVHFLRMMVKMLLPIWFLSWTILLPINSVRHEGLTGLDRFTFGNISRTDQSRYAAHLTLAYVFTFWILYVLKKEMRHFITVRQRHLIDPGHRATPQAKTMLMTGVPPSISTRLLSEVCSLFFLGGWTNWRGRGGRGSLKGGRVSPINPLRRVGPLHFLQAVQKMQRNSPSLWLSVSYLPINTASQPNGLRNATRPSTEMYPRLNSAFVLFNEQIAAHIASQALVHHEPYRMAAKYTEVAPKDVIWSNLNMNPYEAKIRTGISYTATAGLILLWAFPVAFIGAVSMCIRLLAQFEGIPRRTGLELSLMTRFFTFQVIHSFLIVTLSAGLVQSLAPLAKNLGSAPTLLANNLPGASTFFLTYILLQLSGIAGGLLQLVPLIIYYVKLFLLGSTPRSVYAITHTLQDVQWGTLFPSVSLIVVITVAYSVISPLINGLACAIFFLLYQTWKYLFLYVLDQPPSTDTGGLFFPKAITHVFVGLYVEQICLAALFFLTQDARSHPSAVPEGWFHIILLDSYAPLFKALPLTLAADRSHQDEVNARTSVDPSVSDSEDRAEDESRY
ncbi:uncharacterized protein EI90DRAFT_3078614, partial [Cantharellus anzutake]|uniref:uncharacterized protein n=1 Tax=Cantharellus anzutake TaxID=1750568 RepID=UPI001908FFE0